MKLMTAVTAEKLISQGRGRMIYPASDSVTYEYCGQEWRVLSHLGTISREKAQARQATPLTGSSVVLGGDTYAIVDAPLWWQSLKSHLAGAWKVEQARLMRVSVTDFMKAFHAARREFVPSGMEYVSTPPAWMFDLIHLFNGKDQHMTFTFDQLDSAMYDALAAQYLAGPDGDMGEGFAAPPGPVELLGRVPIEQPAASQAERLLSELLSTILGKPVTYGSASELEGLAADAQMRLNRKHAAFHAALPHDVAGHLSPAQQCQHEAQTGPVLLAERYQDNVMTWASHCFGQTTAQDRQERVYRFFEEATELAQACGMSQAECLQLLDYVYGRQVGEAPQEVGGVMVTLAALCGAWGYDLQGSANAELARVWGKVEKIRAKHESKPQGVKTPLPGAGSPSPSAAAACEALGIRLSPPASPLLSLGELAQPLLELLEVTQLDGQRAGVWAAAEWLGKALDLGSPAELADRLFARLNISPLKLYLHKRGRVYVEVMRGEAVEDIQKGERLVCYRSLYLPSMSWVRREALFNEPDRYMPLGGTHEQ